MSTPDSHHQDTQLEADACACPAESPAHLEAQPQLEFKISVRKVPMKVQARGVLAE